MINIEKIKEEVCRITHDLDRKVAMQVIDYLSENGYLKDECKTFFDAWFAFDGDVNGLAEFCDSLNWNSFKKGGKDKKGNFIIFLVDGNKSIGAIRSRSTKLHISALNYLRGDAELKGE